MKKKLGFKTSEKKKQVIEMPESVKTLERFQEILKQHTKVIVDFSAAWCGPCQVMGPVFEKLAETYEQEVYFVTIDVDEVTDIADTYNITSLPSIKSFVNGKSVPKLDMRGADIPKLTKLVQDLVTH